MPAESGGTLAFIDAGAGNTIAFVCIDSPEFSGGRGGPFASDGLVANGCFFIDGIGTDVVAVFREDPSVVPGCDAIVSISAGLQGAVATPTAALTPTATAVPPTATSVPSTPTNVPPTATATATRTATMPPGATATPTRTATMPPMNTATPTPGSTSTPTMVPPTMRPTQPAATPTRPRPTVLPPNTGGGTSGGDGGNTTLFAGIAMMMVAAGAGALYMSRKTERTRS